MAFDLVGGMFTTIVFCMIVFAIMASLVSHYKIKFLHESGVAIISGIIIALISFRLLKLEIKLEFELEHFLYLFLPPIIFAEEKPFSLSGYEIAVLSSALSSKDSFTASLQIDHHLLPDLHTIVFGEGLVNDSTALTLFNAIINFTAAELENIDGDDALKIFLKTLFSFLVATSIGAAVGIIGSLGLKHLRFFRTNPLYELMYIFFTAYLSYTITEMFHYAGVVSLLIVGIFLGSYGWYNLSEKAKVCTNITYQLLSNISEALMFLFVGFSIINPIKDSQEKDVQQFSWNLIIFNIMFLIVSRLFIVFFMSFLIRLVKKQRFVMNIKELLLLTWCGIPRGVLSFAVITQIQSEHKVIIQSTVLYIVVGTTLFMSSFTPLIQYLFFKDLEHGHGHGHDYGHNDHSKNKHNDTEMNDKKPSDNHDNQLTVAQKEQIAHMDKLRIKAKRLILLKQGKFDPSLYKTKLTYYVNKFNQGFLKPFLIDNYIDQCTEMEISKKLFKENTWQISRPQEYNKDDDDESIRDSMMTESTILDSEINNSNSTERDVSGQQLQKQQTLGLQKQKTQSEPNNTGTFDKMLKRKTTLKALLLEKMLINALNEPTNQEKKEENNNNKNNFKEYNTNNDSIELRIGQQQNIINPVLTQESNLNKLL